MTTLESMLVVLVVWLWAIGGVLAAGFVIYTDDLDQPKVTSAFLIFLLVTWPIMALFAFLSTGSKRKH